MIKNKSLCELSEIVEKINKENISFQELNKLVEDADFLLNILQSVNKTSLKKLMPAKKTSSKTAKVVVPVSYTRDEVHKIISSSTPKEIQEKYTVKQLKAMFTAVYGVTPRSSQKKNEILQEIINWFSDDKRTKALSKL